MINIRSNNFLFKCKTSSQRYFDFWNIVDLICNLKIISKSWLIPWQDLLYCLNFFYYFGRNLKTSFSKSLLDILSIKKDFLIQNDEHLKKTLRVYDKYNHQKLRSHCKNCQLPLDKDHYDIQSHGVKYKICKECGHFNWDREDSSEFTEWLYKNDGGSNYSNNYLNNYHSRISNIYLPKATYLKDSLSEICGIKNFSLHDFGCGGGHFVYACNSLGIKAKGVDISVELINLASKYWDQSQEFDENPPFSTVSSEDELIREIAGSKSDVISFIGVLEHLMNPNNALKAFIKSRAKYMYFSVPLFSLSVFIENICRNTFPRQLIGGHTHLYTHESIDYFCNKYSFE